MVCLLQSYLSTLVELKARLNFFCFVAGGGSDIGILLPGAALILVLCRCRGEWILIVEYCCPFLKKIGA